MSDVPFGFGLPDRDPERRDPEGRDPEGREPERGQPGGGAPGGGDPGGGQRGGGPTPADPFGLGALFGGMAGGGSPEDVLGKMPLFAELQKLMSWSGGPVNWDLARQGAISQLAA